ncbi:Hypothetical predicted protein [Podarcis lilfordi]|uniref:Uncharacterized protein n=1 Tax=Podarcis lilfordi TaxID=74358 RepID=A0AA35P3Y9_9SAUR|nr:Hypothetical predicted protein [Podarcis lilfordi]
MKTAFVLFALAFLVFQATAKPNPDVLAEDDAQMPAEDVPRPRNAMVCNAMGGNCRPGCYANEKSVGKCFANMCCCVGFQ